VAKSKADTPLMKQYHAIKAKHPEALLLFRVGDFYETFGSDAVLASKILGITLTKRSNGAAADVELAGFPHHALDTYLPKLVRAGQRVAVCDQLEDPKATKRIVKRGVTELVTPGVTYNDQVLDQGKNNYVAAWLPGGATTGVAFLDISTGEFHVAEGHSAYAEQLVQAMEPAEILIPRLHRTAFNNQFLSSFYHFVLEDWVFEAAFATDLLLQQFKVKNLKGFGIDGFSEGVGAAGAILHYLKETQHDRLAHITGISRIDSERQVWMDRFTLRNLELLGSSNEGGITLYDVMNRTVTSGGARCLQKWMRFPLVQLSPIKERQEWVQAFLNNPQASEQTQGILEQMADLERLASKISAGRINPRELDRLRDSLERIPELTEVLHLLGMEEPLLQKKMLAPCTEAVAILRTELAEEPPVALHKGGVIAPGASAELDEYRTLATSSEELLEGLRADGAEASGISSLKLGFNNVFGYYLEVTHAHRDKVPESWVRKQTLVNAERYITPELKVLEQKILDARDSIQSLELQLYTNLVQRLQRYISIFQQNARIIAEIDVLHGFAALAKEAHYVRPQWVEEPVLRIVGGRHPVIEKLLPPEKPYVANDVTLDSKQQIWMITGPNMSGKSALLRQTALIALMAQMGSCVPATHVEMGIIDKVFVRVGASDNLSQGESTFMVEMNETASILNNLSERSLILLDEIGRGTSTYDGISIAWSIAEYLHEYRTRPKTLFATHYHELNEMESAFERIANYNVSVMEHAGSIVFVRKLERGGSAHSFGIHVAQMAGMPNAVVRRAEKMLESLESQRGEAPSPSVSGGVMDDVQLSFFQLDDPSLTQIRDEISGLDIDHLTPVEALLKLHEIKKIIGG